MRYFVFRSGDTVNIWALREDGKERCIYSKSEYEGSDADYSIVWHDPDNEGDDHLSELVNRSPWEEITEEEAFAEML